MAPITSYGSFTKQIADQINANINAAGLGFLNGNIIMLDPFAGVDTNNGITAPVNTLGRAYGVGREGKNDVIALISNGLTTSTGRIASTFTWAKDALHLVGVCSGVGISNRARIAPTTAATAFANFFKITGSGCLFQNLQWFDGFTTGTTSQICLTISGGRNVFQNTHIAGMGDNESAQNSGSRSIKFAAGGSENLFQGCTIGLDTIVRTTTNASVEFSGGVARNIFRDSIFPFCATGGGALGVKSLTGGIDRFQLFERCSFINGINSSGASMTSLGSVGANGGGPNGIIVYKDCGLVGIAEWEATTKTSVYVVGPAVSSSMGIGVNPA